MNISYKNKTYKCKVCKESFTKNKSTDRYCSSKCAKSDFKPISRGLIKKRVSISNRKFELVKSTLKCEIASEDGYISCQHCGINNSFAWETHHIFYRSEMPNHKYLNDPRNLIVLCCECHSWFHEKKDNRNRLVEERGLKQLFGLNL
jgi:hypothetical protein